MLKQIIKVLPVLVLLWSIMSCTNDKREAVEPGIIICDSIPATYNDVIRPIVHTNCAKSGCHDGVSGVPRFLNYSDMTPYLLDNSIMKRINAKENSPLFMPDDGPMTPCDLQKLNEWLDNGFPNN